MLIAAGCLYGANIMWTILYDMVYAHMDISDDVGAGVKSIAVKHEANTKIILTGLAAGMVGLLAGAGVATGAGVTFYAISCGGATLTLGAMIKRVRLKDPRNIWWWFCNNCWMTGGVISLGLAIDYCLSYIDDQSEECLD
ncbi:Para-hydroxybenzoate--polyprenyltransferase, mitochondrial precursor (PHB:polyprenyltransferase) [Fusarium equiseti]|uniref:Para-hydroxybenzoate--polyprenyltransferase, mitochondrial (PHB:polyprenyltransferase) n=1 Tax=Fusarium equiseti TaxID=61235 RepID=A0ABQ8QUW7_FUSEQ|nr:Para-hydroxybenzoate--polyprenyltransferase, mitochondrial precursor (PHB:polyprenyltransferase) [Fusarium equiseti]